MAVGGDRRRSARAPSRERAIFELERFGWTAPERLELSGRFVGLGDVAPADVVLVVRGSAGTYRLPAVPDDAPGTSQDRRRWRAAFVWAGAPAPFDTATLMIGSELSVELPEPRPKRRPFGGVILDVRRAGAEPDGPAQEHGAADEPAERLHWEPELLAAQQTAQEVRSALERTREELARARADLAAERRLREADAERFRDGLARVRASAEDAIGASDVLVAEARAELEQARREVGELRTALDRLRADEAEMRDAVETARADAARVRDRLAALREALGEEG